MSRPINEHPTYSLAARNIALRQERDELLAQYDALAAEVRRLVEDDPINGYGGFVTREEPGGGDYSKWPAVEKVLKEQTRP